MRELNAQKLSEKRETLHCLHSPFEKLQTDLVSRVLLYLPYEDIMLLSSVSKVLNNLYDKNIVWKSLLKREFQFISV